MSEESISSKEKLARALEARSRGMERTEFVETMIESARFGVYDDFESLLPTPKVKLVDDLRRAGFDDLVQQVIRGDFDSTPEEAQAWLKNEGNRIFKNIFPKID